MNDAVAAATGAPDAAALLVELGAIMVVLAVLARIASYLGVSPVPLYLLVGLALGTGGVFPLEESREFIEASSHVGVILLLLVLGLEYNPDEFTRSLRRGRPAALVDAALNATPGAIAGMLLGLEPVGWLVLAGVTWVSSSGIVSKVLNDLRWLGNRESPVVLSILVLEDLSMAVYLPILSALLLGASLAGTAATITVALALVALILFTVLRYGHRLSNRLADTDDEQLLLRLVGITLLVAGIAESLHVSAAVGAFLVGLGLSGDIAPRARQVVLPLRDVFAAAFFVSFGLSIDPADLPPVLPAALALAIVTAGTKIATGWWAARREGIAVRGRIRAGTALVARGEFSIVVASLATMAGVEGVIEFVTAYVLLLAIGGPFLARYHGVLLRGGSGDPA